MLLGGASVDSCNVDAVRHALLSSMPSQLSPSKPTLPRTVVAVVWQRQAQPHCVQRVRERGGGHAGAGARQQAARHAQLSVLIC